jgi:DNA-binding LacI/PurR family transcriptional regulator
MPRLTDILNDLIQAISAGIYQPGDRLPPIRELAVTLNCSPATLAAVFRELAQRGYIHSRGRLGTHITEQSAWGHTPEQHSSQLIGVMLTETSAMLPTIESQLHKAGYSMVVAQQIRSCDAALACIEHWRKMGLHGVIWSPISSPNHLDDNQAIARAIAASGLQAVAVDRYPQTMEVNAVVSDNAHAAALLTHHLLELGHQRIGLIRHRHGSTPEDRTQGYRQALREYHIKSPNALVLTVDHGIAVEMLIERISNWISRTRPTAVWSIAGSPLGQALLAATQRLGLRIPEDISIATFDEVIAAIPMTCIIQPMDAIARRAVALLLSNMKQTESEITRIVLPSVLHIGQSTAKPSPKRQKVPS